LRAGQTLRSGSARRTINTIAAGLAGLAAFTGQSTLALRSRRTRAADHTIEAIAAGLARFATLAAFATLADRTGRTGWPRTAIGAVAAGLAGNAALTDQTTFTGCAGQSLRTLGAINTGRPTCAVFQLGQARGRHRVPLVARFQQLGAHGGKELAPLRFDQFAISRPLLAQLGDCICGSQQTHINHVLKCAVAVVVPR
jgi:hypothetical protein